jgi:hypothetical protein
MSTSMESEGSLPYLQEPVLSHKNPTYVTPDFLEINFSISLPSSSGGFPSSGFLTKILC